jgi:hypothetical protein
MISENENRKAYKISGYINIDYNLILEKKITIINIFKITDKLKK